MKPSYKPKSGFRHRLLTASLWVIAVAVAGVGLYYFLQINHGCDWTGLGECRISTQQSEEVRLARTLWDWLELLIVPIVLAGTGFVFNRAIQTSERTSSEHRALLERQIAEDGLRETALQSYLDKMSDLLLDRKLRTSAEGDEVRAVARSKTLTVLRRLDGNRRAVLLRFLKESNLIDAPNAVVDLQGGALDECELELVDLQGCSIEGVSLRGAMLAQSLLSESNLSEVNFSQANLRSADLRKSLLFRANLSKVNMAGADLRGADMRFADLRGAELVEANLESANLSQADLSSANLNKALITKEQIASCRSVAGAMLPEILN